jgi:predicted AAA+ superfamily ATPase
MLNQILAVLLIGKRNSGKTTVLRGMVENLNAATLSLWEINTPEIAGDTEGMME